MTETLESELYRAKVVQEKKRRDDWRTRVRALSFPKQLEFVDDPSKLKSALCTRRAGKTNAAGIDCLDVAYNEPGSNFLFIGLTGDSARTVIWNEVLEPMSRKLGKKLAHSEHKKRVRFPGSGSVLYYVGVDSSTDEFKKLLGKKYKRIYIDEGASYTCDMQALIEVDLMPATIDEDGKIWFFSAPNDYTHTYFYKVTTGEIPGWSHHHWSALDNPYIAEKFAAEIARLKRERPGIENTPWFIQQYLGRWAVDDEKLCYPYRESRNGYHSLFVSEWHFLTGIDLGWGDDSAFVVSAYRDYDPKLYYPYAYKRKGMDISAVAEMAKQVERSYPSYRQVIDGANKQAVEELKTRHKMHKLETADKAGKSDFIFLMQNDFLLGNIQADITKAVPLIDEWKALTWDPKLLLKGKYVELESKPNHCCDAALYAWRFALNWIDRGVQTNLNKTVDERMEDQWEAEAERSMSDIGKPFYEREENAWE